MDISDSDLSVSDVSSSESDSDLASNPLASPSVQLAQRAAYENAKRKREQLYEGDEKGFRYKLKKRAAKAKAAAAKDAAAAAKAAEKDRREFDESLETTIYKTDLAINGLLPDELHKYKIDFKLLKKFFIPKVDDFDSDDFDIDDFPLPDFIDTEFTVENLKKAFVLKDDVHAAAVLERIKLLQSNVQKTYIDAIKMKIDKYFWPKVLGSYCKPTLLIPYEVVSTPRLNDRVYELLSSPELFAKEIVPFIKGGTITAPNLLWKVGVEKLGLDTADGLIGGITFSVPHRNGASNTQYFEGKLKDDTTVSVELDEETIERIAPLGVPPRSLNKYEREDWESGPLEVRRPLCGRSGFIDLASQLRLADQSATGIEADVFKLQNVQLTPEWHHRLIKHGEGLGLRDVFFSSINTAVGIDLEDKISFCVYNEAESIKGGRVVVDTVRINLTVGNYEYSAIEPSKSTISVTYVVPGKPPKRMYQKIEPHESFLYKYVAKPESKNEDFARNPPKSLGFGPLYNICIMRAWLIAVFVVAAENGVGGSLA